MDSTVKAVQRRLIELGYSIGAAKDDGIMGVATAKALAKFRADRALSIKYPGTIGPITITALDFDAATGGYEHTESTNRIRFAV